MKNKTTLITGGCRSGKSKFALTLGSGYRGGRIFLATAQAFDDEMRERISAHKKERGDQWMTLEEPIDPGAAIANISSKPEILLVDCLTLWICNLLMKDITRTEILSKAKELIKQCRGLGFDVIFITNEVGAGIVPEGKLSRDFRDIAGEVNQLVAESFDDVVHMISGIPQYIKQTNPGNPNMKGSESHEFPKEKKEGLYEAIYKRRDIRHFKPNPVPEELLNRILHAAHHAGSVGLMEPWNFVIVDEPGIKQRMAANFKQANAEAIKAYEGERRELYSSLKLEGIEDAPVNIAVTCDENRKGPTVLGTQSMPETAVYSTVCAVQNLWLAARAEGLAVGWVSILTPEIVKKELNIPDEIKLVAYLCLGFTDSFGDVPLLEVAGWEKRSSLESFVYHNHWGVAPQSFDAPPPNINPKLIN